MLLLGASFSAVRVFVVKHIINIYIPILATTLLLDLQVTANAGVTKLDTPKSTRS